MEWLLLVLLVPAIVVPVVLLWGFAGCQIFFPLDEHPPPPPAPQQLEATPSSTTSISLTWMHSGVGVQFEVQRAADGGPFEFLGTVPAPPFLDPPSFGTPPPLEPGVTYHYQIFAVDSQSRSEGSNIADARPLAFQFDLSSGNNQNRAGDTIVQKIGSNLLKNWGAVVRIHLRGTPGDPLIIDSIYMSGVATATADNPTPDAWDSAGDIKLVASAVTVPANSSQVVNSSNHTRFQILRQTC